MDVSTHKYIFVYQTINQINGKSYVGVHATNDIDDGYIGCGVFKQSDAWKNLSFHRAVRKYGYTSFRRYILCFYDTYNEALLEEKYIVNRSWVKNIQNYNVALGGLGGAMLSMSEESKRKIYAKVAAKNKGKKRSKEFCEMLSKKKSGVPLSEKHKDALKASNARYWLGKKRSQKSINKLRESLVGRKLTEEHKQKLSLAKKNKPSPKAKAVIQYNINGQLIGEYRSIPEAAIMCNIVRSTLHLHIQKGTIKNDKYFKYKEEVTV